MSPIRGLHLPDLSARRLCQPVLFTASHRIWVNNSGSVCSVVMNPPPEPVIGSSCWWLHLEGEQDSRSMGAARKKIDEQIRYLENRKAGDLLNYKRLKDANLPVGSGVVEAACKTLASQRLKCSGMSWSHRGAESILTHKATAGRQLGISSPRTIDPRSAWDESERRSGSLRRTPKAAPRPFERSEIPNKLRRRHAENRLYLLMKVPCIPAALPKPRGTNRKTALSSHLDNVIRRHPVALRSDSIPSLIFN